MLNVLITEKIIKQMNLNFNGLKRAFYENLQSLSHAK